MERDDEANFARRMAELRAEMGLSQSELARKMIDRGFDTYSQMTVSRTEKGERPIRLGEARVLAEILGSRIEDMTRGTDLDELLRIGEQVSSGLQTGIASIADAMSDYAEALEASSEISDRLRRHDEEPVRAVLEDMRAYRYPLDAVARWAAEVVRDEMDEWPRSIAWTDLSRMRAIEEEGGGDGERQAAP